MTHATRARHGNPRVLGTAVCGALIPCIVGCALEEVRGKTSFGQEFRHSGASNTNDVRYDAQQGIEFHWDNDMTTGVSYRRRDVDQGSGDNDNLVQLDVGYPIWKRKHRSADLADRVKELEARLAELERRDDGGEPVNSAPGEQRPGFSNEIVKDVPSHAK